MKNKIKATIKKYNMLSSDDSVIVGCSGGADSMTLLHFLHTHSDELEIKVYAAHINHCLRGEEANRDELFVREWCKNAGVECFVCKVDVFKKAEDEKIGLEECGRRVRYEFFDKLSKKMNAKIATAHTVSDRMETTLFHLARGTGLQGLYGIPPKRGNIIRPIIDVTREEVEGYCEENNVEFVTDSTNLQSEYTRNKIRHNVIPVLYEINPSFDRAYLRTFEQLHEEDKYMNKQALEFLQKAKTAYGYSTEILNKCEDIILNRCLYEITKDSSCERVHIELLANAIRLGEGSVTLPGNRIYKVKNKLLSISNNQETSFDEWQVAYNGEAEAILPEKKLLFSRVNQKKFKEIIKINKTLLNNAINYDTITCNTIIRNRREGDCFSPVKRGITKKVKKMMLEYKIPQQVRQKLAMLCSENEILWIEGIGISEKARVDDTTTDILVISIEEQ